MKAPVKGPEGPTPYAFIHIHSFIHSFISPVTDFHSSNAEISYD
jgi:hypothetical protein